MRQQVTDMQMPRPAQQPSQPSMPPREHHYMTLVWGLIVLIIVVVGALWLLGGKTERTFDANGNEIIHARAGEVITGFPAELLAENVTPEASYVINYEDEGRRLFQVRYISNLLYDENVALYKSKLDEAGWSFTRYPGSEAPVTNIGAVKDGAEVSVTVVFKPNADVVVEIAYLSPSTNPEAIAEEVATSEEEEVMEDDTVMEEAPEAL